MKKYSKESKKVKIEISDNCFIVLPAKMDNSLELMSSIGVLTAMYTYECCINHHMDKEKFKQMMNEYIDSVLNKEYEQ